MPIANLSVTFFVKGLVIEDAEPSDKELLRMFIGKVQPEDIEEYDFTDPESGEDLFFDGGKWIESEGND